MTRDQVVQLLGWRLGDRSDMAERIALEMVMVQETLLEGNKWLPWFLEKEWVGATTMAGMPSVAVPTDFLEEIEEGHLYLTTPAGVELRLVKKDYDTANSLTFGRSPGQPEYYARLGEAFYFFPTPDLDYPLAMQYYGRDAGMADANVETLWLKHASDVAIAAIGKELCEKHIQNPEQAVAFGNDLQKAWDRLYVKHIAMQEINAARVMGGND